MQTIKDLEQQLKQAKAAQTKTEGSLYKTNIIIDLQSPEGNVFYIMGLCARLFDQLGLGRDEHKKYYDECRGGYYRDVLAISRRWFGFIYLNEPTNHKTKGAQK